VRGSFIDRAINDLRGTGNGELNRFDPRNPDLTPSSFPWHLSTSM